MIEDALFLGLFTFGTVTFVRMVLSDVQWLTRSIAKVVLVGVVANAGAFLMTSSEEPKTTLLVAWAGFGVALLAHRLHRLLGAVGDRARLEVLQGDARRRR